MTPYRIHLRGPWEVTGPWVDGVSQEWRTVTLPAAWQSLFGTRSGTATFRRWFHRPTNLVPDDQIAFVLTGVRGAGHARLNDDPWNPLVIHNTAAAIPVTVAQLRQRNRLEIELTFDPSATSEPGGLFEAVALEIISIQ